MSGPATSAAATSTSTSTSTSTTWWQRLLAALRRLFGQAPSSSSSKKKPTPKPRLSNEEWQAQEQTLRAALAPWVARVGIPYWVPVCVDVDAEVDVDVDAAGRSWFGGGALLGADAVWPVCRACQKPMHHFLQLDVAMLPAGAWPSSSTATGLLSLFYCSTDDGNCEVWNSESGATAIVHTTVESVALQKSPHPKPMKQRNIVSFTEQRDPPAGHPSVEWREGVVSVDGVAVAHDIDENVFADVVSAAAGDKIGGAPFELQGPQPHPCPVCQREMQQLCQIDSNVNLEYMFGDSGCAHIVQCSEHPEQRAFWWDCC